MFSIYFSLRELLKIPSPIRKVARVRDVRVVHTANNVHRIFPDWYGLLTHHTRLLLAGHLSSALLCRPAGSGLVEPKRKQGCLRKSCHSLNFGMENFASVLSGRFWPFSEVANVGFVILQSQNLASDDW